MASGSTAEPVPPRSVSASTTDAKPKTPAKKAPSKPASKAAVTPTPTRLPQVLYAAPPFVTKQFQAGELAAIKAAIKAADNGQLEQARAAANSLRSPILNSLLTYLWIIRPGSTATFEDIAGFQATHSEWPSQDLMRRRAEALLAEDSSDTKVLGYYQTRLPLLGEARFRLGEAQMRQGLVEDAVRNLREGWVAGNFSQKEEADAIQRYTGILLAEDHIRRLDRLIWEGERIAARRMLSLVNADTKAVAEARLGLQETLPNADSLVSRLPPHLQNDPGLIYERVRWRRLKGLDDDAATMLIRHGPDVPYADRWWTERQYFARRALKQGAVSDAYRLAVLNGVSDSKILSEAEFLAGWIALRYLNEGKVALEHFTKLTQAVKSPVSLARGAYWSGRAAESLGDQSLAETWYERASEYGVAYYGQLATARLNKNKTLNLRPDPEITQADIHNFEKRPLARAAIYLSAAEYRDRMRAFIMRMNDTATTEAEHLLVATFAEKLGRVDLGIAAAKRSAQNGVTITSRAFPIITSIGGNEERPESALVLALSRQESEFRPDAISRVGARGLMQLMPATALSMAKAIGVSYNENALTEPEYNVKLGRYYLGHLLDNYNGHYVLALAAYNAGPGRVSSWIQISGDPRSDTVDTIDWVELIPFAETRNYVQRVIEGVQVYRQLLNPRATVVLGIENDLKGRRGL